MQTRPPRCAWHTECLRSGLSSPRAPCSPAYVPHGPCLCPVGLPGLLQLPLLTALGLDRALHGSLGLGQRGTGRPCQAWVRSWRGGSAPWVRCCPAVSLPPGPGGLPAKSPAESPQSGFTSSSRPGAGPRSALPRPWGGEKSESAAGAGIKEQDFTKDLSENLTPAQST